MIELKDVKPYLDKCENPLILFDDDPDGLSSYLLFYHYLKKGSRVIVKNSPVLDESYVIRVRQYSPDLVIVLDKPIISQEFIDKISVPIIWVDHHPIVDVKGVKYFNPRFKDKKDNRPTTYWSYKLLKGPEWLALLGIISDWNLAGVKTLKKKYKELFKGVKLENPDDVLFDTEFGKLIRIVSFNLKGVVKGTYQFVSLMEKIEDPYEILEQKTEAGKKIYAKYEKVNKEYVNFYEEAMKQKDEEILVYRYATKNYSFTSDLSNELLHRVKARVIFIGRVDGDYIKASVRNRDGGKALPVILKKALDGLDGYGGGHDRASGCCVNVKDFDEFIKRFKKLV